MRRYLRAMNSIPQEYQTWRERARPIIERVLRETQGQEQKAIAKALRGVYPWGAMENYPYKAWRDEIKAQRGDKAAHERAMKQMSRADMEALWEQPLFREEARA